VKTGEEENVCLLKTGELGLGGKPRGGKTAVERRRTTLLGKKKLGSPREIGNERRLDRRFFSNLAYERRGAKLEIFEYGKRWK